MNIYLMGNLFSERSLKGGNVGKADKAIWHIFPDRDSRNWKSGI